MEQDGKDNVVVDAHGLDTPEGTPNEQIANHSTFDRQCHKLQCMLKGSRFVIDQQVLDTIVNLVAGLSLLQRLRNTSK